MTNHSEAEFLTDQYLHHAVQSVDARLGEGYAKKNPQLVSTMVTLTAEVDFHYKTKSTAPLTSTNHNS